MSFVFVIMSADTTDTEMHTVTVVSLFFEAGKSGTNYVHKEKSRVTISSSLRYLKDLKERVW